jgi:hypothetical protein
MKSGMDGWYSSASFPTVTMVTVGRPLGPHDEAPGSQAPGRFVLLDSADGYSSSSAISAAAVKAGTGTGSSTRGGGGSKPAGGWMSISA